MENALRGRFPCQKHPRINFLRHNGGVNSDFPTFPTYGGAGGEPQREGRSPEPPPPRRGGVLPSSRYGRKNMGFSGCHGGKNLGFHKSHGCKKMT